MIFVPRLRPLTAFALAGLYSSATPWALALMIWTVGNRNPEQALSQPAPFTEVTAIPSPTTEPSEEAAQQRLPVREEVPTLLPTRGLDAINPSLPPEPAFNLYRLGIGDAITVIVQRFPDLSFQAALDQQGNITHPLLGKIALQGLTMDQAQARITQTVNQIVIDPVVLVSLTGQRPVFITLTGEIGRPGLYNLSQNGGGAPRVATALLLAGGTTQRSNLQAVKVQRTLPNGTSVEQTVDLIKPLQQGTPLPDLRLQDGDVVTVPRLDPVKDQNYDRNLMARSFGKGKVTVRFLSYATGRLAQIDLPIDSTFIDALTVIGPTPDNTNLRKIALVRFDATQSKAITRELDGKKALMGDPSQNPTLEDNDVIVIGRNLVGKLTYALNTFTQPFRDVLGFLLFFKELQNSATNLFSPNNRTGN
jgi:polysaccharide biosynthesis/export protein